MNTHINLCGLPEPIRSQAIESGVAPAGWYTIEAVGPDEEWEQMDLVSTDPDYPRDQMPDFTYWNEEITLVERDSME